MAGRKFRLLAPFPGQVSFNQLPVGIGERRIADDDFCEIAVKPERGTGVLTEHHVARH
jgi:hypothetical protein